MAESCTGLSSDCPADGFEPATTTCTGTSNGAECDDDPADHCSGTDSLCLDVFQPSTYECRVSSAVCDPAEFCTGSSGSCPVDAVNQSAPVGATVRLNHDKLSGDTTIRWDDEVLDGPFNVYRGSITIGSPWSYNQSCFAEAETTMKTTDDQTPTPVRLFFYLVSRKQSPCTESNVGQASSGTERPNPAICGGPAPDTDGDGCDNCLLTFNPTQSDVDADTLGDDCDPDIDNDGVLNGDDNYLYHWNPDQEDSDNDEVGDACESVELRKGPSSP